MSAAQENGKPSGSVLSDAPEADRQEENSNPSVPPSGGAAQDEQQRAQVFVSWAVGYGSVDGLMEAADLVIKGRVSGVDDTYENRKINFTDFRVKVLETLKGSSESVIAVKQTGAAGWEVSDDPLFEPDAVYYLFLKKPTAGAYYVAGGPQGRFVVIDGTVNSLSTVYPERDIRDLKISSKPEDAFIADLQ